MFYGISLFPYQYYLSGLLDSNNVDSLTIHITMIILMIVGIVGFDTSIAGLLLAGYYHYLQLINIIMTLIKY